MPDEIENLCVRSGEVMKVKVAGGDLEISFRQVEGVLVRKKGQDRGCASV